jgi:hypothetical protein
MGQEHLAPVRGCGDACGAMDIQANVALVGEQGLTHVQAHPHAHSRPRWPGVLCQNTLGLGSGPNGVSRASKRDEECVTLGIHLVAVMGGEGIAQDALMFSKNARVSIAEQAQHLCTALDVRE